MNRRSWPFTLTIKGTAGPGVRDAAHARGVDERVGERVQNMVTERVVPDASAKTGRNFEAPQVDREVRRAPAEREPDAVVATARGLRRMVDQGATTSANKIPADKQRGVISIISSFATGDKFDTLYRFIANVPKRASAADSFSSARQLKARFPGAVSLARGSARQGPIRRRRNRS